MTKIDWASKLASRKFWVAVVGLVSGILLAFRVDENTVTQISGIIMAAASVVAYILGEAWTDASDAKANNTIASSGYVAWEPETKPPEDPTEDDGR
jgi:hypothetical protein